MRTHQSPLLLLVLLVASSAIGQIVIHSGSVPDASELPAEVGQIIRAAPAFSSANLGYFGPLPDDPLGMLQRKQIQQEVNLTQDQIALVKELQADIQRQTTEIFRSQAKFGGNAGEMMRAAQKAIQKNITKELQGILDAKQHKRLNQLEIQLKMKNRGVRALTDDRLAEALNISDEQKKEIRDQAQETNKKLQEEIKKLRDRYRTQLIKRVLNEDQLSSLEELSGEEYEVKPVNVRRLGR